MPQQPTPPTLTESAAKWLFGFLGTIVGFLLLPPTIRLLIRKYALRFMAEILAIVTLGLVSGEAAERLSGHGKEKQESLPPR